MSQWITALALVALVVIEFIRFWRGGVEVIHKVSIVRTESADGDYWLALCPCGWRRNIAVDAPFYGYTAEEHIRRWSKRHETYPPMIGVA